MPRKGKLGRRCLPEAQALAVLARSGLSISCSRHCLLFKAERAVNLLLYCSRPSGLWTPRESCACCTPRGCCCLLRGKVVGYRDVIVRRYYCPCSYHRIAVVAIAVVAARQVARAKCGRKRVGNSLFAPRVLRKRHAAATRALHRLLQRRPQDERAREQCQGPLPVPPLPLPLPLPLLFPLPLHLAP